MGTWGTDRIPDQAGRTALVTGANSGLGLISARELARAGATVLVAAREQSKCEAAEADIRREVPDAKLDPLVLDLADLASVRAAAETVSSRAGGLDVLMNNAGVMMPPRSRDRRRVRTAVRDQPPRPLRAHRPAAREPRRGGPARGDGDQPRAPPRSDRFRRPSVGERLRPAGRLPALEALQRRLRDRARPAPARGRLAGEERARPPGLLRHKPSEHGSHRLDEAGPEDRQRARRPERGAMARCPSSTPPPRPTWRAASSIGPDGFRETRGAPTRVRATSRANDPELGRRLWEISEELTGVSYDI